MKILTHLMYFFLFLLPIISSASTPVARPVVVDGVFIPMGFDANDSAELVVTGFLPNLCHKFPEASVKIDKKNIAIKLTALVYDQTDPFCAPIVVPFMERVSLGLLDRGEYKVSVNSKTPFEKKSSLKVFESTSQAVDDFIYANVEYVEKTLGSREITLVGNHPSDCFELESIDFISNKVNTYSVLPRLRRVSDFCPMKLVPFAYKATVPNDLKNDKILLHVRVMDGKSVNTILHNN